MNRFWCKLAQVVLAARTWSGQLRELWGQKLKVSGVTGPSPPHDHKFGTVCRRISDYVGCYSASSGGHWRHFYLHSDATVQCELFLTAPNRNILTYLLGGQCRPGGGIILGPLGRVDVLIQETAVVGDLPTLFINGVCGTLNSMLNWITTQTDPHSLILDYVCTADIYKYLVSPKHR